KSVRGRFGHGPEARIGPDGADLAGRLEEQLVDLPAGGAGDVDRGEVPPAEAPTGAVDGHGHRVIAAATAEVEGHVQLHHHGHLHNFVGAGRSGRPCLLAVALGAVLGAGLLAVGHALGVVDAADDVVPHAGQVAHAAAADEDDGVLLEVVALAGDVGGDL